LTLKQIGLVIKYLRGTRPQQEIADKAGMTQCQISGIESGRDFQVSTLIKLAKALGSKVKNIMEV
jgi:transcriptional regulator with XRE-family HTH domain